MAQALILRRGGGGESTFRIVGGTSRPSAPVANTLWISTLDTIGGVAVQSSPPTTIDGEAVSSGDVWVRTATNGGAIGIYRGIAYIFGVVYMYNGTSWVIQIAEYYDTVWTPIWPYLYYDGIEQIVTAGGWAAISGSVGATKNSTTLQNSITTANTQSWFTTVNPISMDNIGFLRFELTGLAAGLSLAGVVGVHTDKTLTTSFSASSSITTTGAKVVGVDVSGLSGNYYVKVGTYTGGTATSRGITVSRVKILYS